MDIRKIDPRALLFAKSALANRTCTVEAAFKLADDLNNAEITLEGEDTLIYKAHELCHILAPEFPGLLDDECCHCKDCVADYHCHGNCDADNRCTGCYEHYESGRDATFYADRARGLYERSAR